MYEVDYPMSHEAETLEAVMESHGITAKALALSTGLHKSTIYRYISGENPIPIQLFRHLYERTHDERIAQLITGGVPTQIVVLIPVEKIGPLPPLNQLLCDATNTLKDCADGVIEVGKIVADGKVDERDLQSIAQFKKHAAACQRRLTQTMAALNRYERDARNAANGEAVSA